MQSETTVSINSSAQLGYFAGALRVARAELERIEAHACEWDADAYAEAMQQARAELAAAEFDYRCEFQACQALEELAAVDSAPVAVAPVAVKAPRVRCPHYKAIRRCYAIAKERGLDCSKAGKARARHAMEDVIGQCVESRAEYTGADWMRFGDAIKAGAVRW